ncbi:hybrid sensor histidine kinase/response regulator [Roseivivax isoporae]|uniref:hybrid sensor histidine kinase/response regulator n=1 Tax=Roseivivax isoporae TaxID=591206 RepID=UPI00138E187A|nr:PAS domain-containing hybrid sensor histidine kinase/response regulator [Roseivivax isoporae]
MAVAAIAALAVTAWMLVREASGRFDALAEAQSDNVQWVLAQVEVEYLALDAQLLRAETEGRASLPDLRLRFDIFYSRIDMLRKSRVYAALRAHADYEAALDTVWSAVAASVPQIDAGDAALVAALPDLGRRMQAIRGDVRAIGLTGIAHFAEASDLRRTGFLDTLRDLASLTLALLAGLMLLVAVLWRALRVLDGHARDARLSASRRAAVVSSSLDAVIVADGTGRIIEANAAVEAVFGYAPGDLVGRQMEETIVPPHLRDRHRSGMARYAATRAPRVVGAGRVQLEALHRDGHTFPIELSIAAAQSVDGEIFVSFLRDITERVAAERELREARDRAEAGERSKSRMLATMSHEMRTPLNGLLGTLELLEDTPLDPTQARYLGVMRSSGDVLLHHINDVLDIARLDAGRMRLEEQCFALNPFLEAIAAAQEPLAEQAGNTLTASGLDGNDHVHGDPVRLRQILLNLLGNAIKFTEGGTVALEAERLPDGDLVELRILDTGLGIPEDQQERIFEDFVTLDASYGRVHGGTGLGLGIVRRTVAALGGTLGVESEPGEGSLFWVRLPLPAAAPGTAAPSRALPAGSPPRSPRRDVLIVEDNAVNRMILREMLEGLGHCVTEAHDGQAGIEAAAERPFDLILMDISMPRIDGVTAARRIRGGQGACRDTPIVALTAHAMPEELARFAAAGMARTIVKPATRAALASVLADPSAPVPSEDAPRGGAAAAPAPAADPIDAAVMAELREMLAPAAFRALCADFVTEADAAIAWLTGPGAAAAPRADLAARVHTLAGGCGMVGAAALRCALSDLETRLKTAPGPVPASALSGLAPLWAGTRPVLAASARGLPEPPPRDQTSRADDLAHC